MTAPDPARLHQSIRQLEGDGGRVDVEQLQQLHAAAEPGKWTVENDDNYGCFLIATTERTGRISFAENLAQEEADFIVAAHTALPALLDLIRRQDAALAAVRELADRWADQGADAYRTGSEVVVSQTDLRAALTLASPDTTLAAGAS